MFVGTPIFVERKKYTAKTRLQKLTKISDYGRK